jgi:transposase
VPPIKPHTTEWRRHQVTCPHCGYKTRAVHDEKVIPPSPFGPRLMAIMGMLTGVYHVSRRSTVRLLSDLLGVRVSLGALSAVEARVGEAVQPVVNEAWEHVRAAGVKHTDGTSWSQAGLSMALWTIATTAATVFKIVADNSKKTLQPLYGALTGILVSDRATSLTFWAMERRQICWAHLIRKFVSFSERDGPAGVFGRQLLDYTGIVFDYWHAYKAGKIDRATFALWMAPVKTQVRDLLDKAVAANIAQVSGACADIVEHEPALWTFVDQGGVEPTNNHAEREIRAFVLWRKRSFGTQSARGNVFAANLMTVAHTARKQKRNVLALLVECCEAHRDGTRAPSLLVPVTAAA